MKEQVERSELLGDGIRLIDRWRKSMKKRMGLYGLTHNMQDVKAADTKHSQAIDLFNEYIKAKNKQFKGKKYTTEMAKATLEKAEALLVDALATYRSIDISDRRASVTLNSAIRGTERLLARIKKEKQYVDKFASG